MRILAFLSVISLCVFATSSFAITHKVLMEISVNKKSAGHMVIGLFGSMVPKTVENFRAMCDNPTAAKKAGFAQSNPLDGNRFHRIFPGYFYEAGDIEHNDGTGGRSIYGKTYPDETFAPRSFPQNGLLAMANRGTDSNGSQFFFLGSPIATYKFQGKYTIFGQIVEGMSALGKVDRVPTDSQGKPLVDAMIKSCREVSLDYRLPAKRKLTRR